MLSSWQSVIPQAPAGSGTTLYCYLHAPDTSPTLAHVTLSGIVNVQDDAHVFKCSTVTRIQHK